MPVSLSASGPARLVRAAVVLLALLALVLSTLATGASASATRATASATSASAAGSTTVTGTVSSTAGPYVDLVKGTTVTGTLSWTSPIADVSLSLRAPGGAVLVRDDSAARPQTLTWTVQVTGRYRWYLTTKVKTAYTLTWTTGAVSTTAAPAVVAPAVVAPTVAAPTVAAPTVAAPAVAAPTAPAPTTVAPTTVAPTTSPVPVPTTAPAGPPVRSGGLTAPTTRTLTPAAFLAEARATGLVQNVTIAGSLVLTDPRDTWTCRNCRVVATGRYGLSSFYATTKLPANGRGTRWENSEVDGAGIATTAVVGSYLTWIDGNVHGATSDLFKPFDHVTVLRGQAHSIRKAVGAHADVIQIVNGRSILVDGLWTDATEADGGNLNAVLQMGALNGDVVDVVLRRMWVNGGHYSLRGIDSSAALSPYTVTGFRLEDNWFGPDHTYGPITAIGPRTTVSGNRWGFTGTTRSSKPRTVVLGQPV